MKKSNTITTILLLLMAVIIFVVSAVKDSNKKSQTEDTLNQIQAVVSPYQNKDKMKSVDIITNFTNSSQDHQPTVKANKSITVSGLIKEGYFYVKASVDKGNSLTQYDGIFVMLQNEGVVLGGHLVKSQSLETPDNKSATEFLYKLSDVKYKKTYDSDNLEVQSGNWLQALNTTGNKKIIGFSSTARTGVLENVTIYYSCVEGSDCSILSQ